MWKRVFHGQFLGFITVHLKISSQRKILDITTINKRENHQQHQPLRQYIIHRMPVFSMINLLSSFAAHCDAVMLSVLIFSVGET